jgi:Lrp/AsnC family leucine-responsive transcriptional regulator
MAETLDHIDQHILKILQADSRLQNQELADQIGLSPSACLRRVRRLESSGLVMGYVALVDPEMVGRGLDVFVRVRLERQTIGVVEAFEVAVAALPEVQACYRMVGEIDFLLHAAMADLQAWDDFYVEHLGPLEGVAGITSMISMRRVKYTTALPV